MDVYAELNKTKTPSFSGEKEGVGWEWNRGCKVCGKRGDLKRCMGCKKVFYCSKECQKFDLKFHKNKCVDDGTEVQFLERVDLEDPCPICLEEAPNEGCFVCCFQCGSSFCGNCISGKHYSSITGCPKCRDNTDRTPEQQVKCLEKLKKRGIDIKYIYPTMGVVKNNIRPSDPSSLIYFVQAVERGSYFAAWKLANLLEQSKGSKDLIREYNLLAASHRIHYSQNWLANKCIESGKEEFGFHWHLRAAENGNKESMKWMAEKIINEDKEKATEWFLEAGRHGCGECYLKYGEIKQDEGDNESAFKAYIESAKTYPEGYYKLGEMYMLGYPEYNLGTAIVMYVAGAECNNINCLVKLGTLYMSFTGKLDFEVSEKEKELLIKQDPNYEKSFVDKAIIFWERATTLESGTAAILLGNYYRDSKNPKKAIEYYNKGAKFGKAIGYYYLGEMYLYGNGVDKDTPFALLNFVRASNAGYGPAKQVLKEVQDKIPIPI